MKIRQATPNDYQALCDLQMAVFPDIPAVVEDFQQADVQLKADERIRWGRFVAERDGQIVGMAMYGQSTWDYRPHRFRAGLRVHPDCQGQGIGRALYEYLLAQLAQYNPSVIHTQSREDLPRGMQFAEQCGFQEVTRASASWLTLADFQPDQFGDVDAQMAEHGIVIQPITALNSDSKMERKLYELDCAVLLDVPSDEPFVAPDFAQWKKDVLGEEMLAAYMVAVHGDEYVGLSNAYGDRASDMLFTGLTGVRHDYRGKGVATALKIKVLTWAKANGNSIVKTVNDHTNAGMLGINYRLGFVKQPAWVEYKKVLRDDD